MHIGRSMSAALCGAYFFAFCSSCLALTSTAPQESRSIGNVITDARSLMALGEYRKALEIYSAALKHYPGSSELQVAYLRAAEEIKHIADAQFEKKNFAGAGVVFHALYTSGILAENLAKPLSFNAEMLTTLIAACSNELLQYGLLQYREGNIEDAIIVWKKVMIFDRGNTDARRAIETATAQLQKLKHIQ